MQSNLSDVFTFMFGYIQVAIKRTTKNVFKTFAERTQHASNRIITESKAHYESEKEKRKKKSNKHRDLSLMSPLFSSFFLFYLFYLKHDALFVLMLLATSFHLE
jgi:hypothetical protein